MPRWVDGSSVRSSSDSRARPSHSRRSRRRPSTPVRSRSRSRRTSAGASPTSRSRRSGRLRADTHGAPLHLRASLREVDVEQLQEGLRRGVDSVAAEVERNTLDAVGTVRRMGGPRRGRRRGGPRPARVPEPMAPGAPRDARRDSSRSSCPSASPRSASTPSAFQAPSYTGSLRLVPQLFGPVEGAIERVGYFREELRRVVAGAARAYAAVESNPLGRGDEVRVLHISDIHLSTLGYGFAQELARSFDVDLVLDTGDTTSFGASQRGVHPLGDPRLRAARTCGCEATTTRPTSRTRSAGSRAPSSSTATRRRSTASRSTGSGTPTSTRQRGTPVGDEDVVALVEAAAGSRHGGRERAPRDRPTSCSSTTTAWRSRSPGSCRSSSRATSTTNRDEVRRRDRVPPRRHDRRRRPHRVHRGGRRAVLGRGALLPARTRRRRDAASWRGTS